MKSIIAIACLVVLLLTASFVVRADIASPKPTQTTENKSIFSSMEIVPDAKATSARLQIRQSAFNELRATFEGTPPNALAASITRNGPRTVIAGLLLFLSVSIGGVWLARASRSSAGVRRGHKAVAIVLITVATLGAAAIITRGNVGPPPGYRWRNLPTALATGQSTAGPVTVEIVPDDQNSGTSMKLIIPIKKESSRGGE